MYVVRDWDDRNTPGAYRTGNIQYSNCLKTLNGKGNYDYTWDGTTMNIPGAMNNYPVFTRGEENPIAGQNDLNCIPFDYDDNGVISIPRYDGNHIETNEHREVWAEMINGVPTATYAATGIADQEFTTDDELSLSGIVPILNYPVYNDLTEQLGSYILNGLYVKILSYNSSTGQYSIEVKFNDFDARNDKRWCGPILLPAKETTANYSLCVKTGVTLSIDKSGTPNRETEITSGSRDYVNPTIFSCAENSVLKLESNSEIEVINESTLQLLNGSHIEVGAGAILRIRTGSYLDLQQGSELKVLDGGSVIIEDGGALLYNGGNIILDGNNATVDFQGNLDITDNTTFTFTGAGYVKFSKTGFPSYNINPGTNSKIWLNGSGVNDKVLEITQETMYAHGLTEFKLTNGKAELHNDSRLSVEGPIVLTNATITSNTGSNNMHRGLCLYGQSGVNISGSIFSYGKYGLYATLTYGGYGLTLNSCYFENNETGLVTVDNCASLTECSFAYNTLYAWEAIGMTQPSTASLSYFQYNFQGIKYEATSTSGLFLTGASRVSYNDYMGIEFYGPAKLSINCSSVKSNGTYYSVAPGILLHHGASLNMSPSQSPICQRNNIWNNYYNIMTEDPANPSSSNNYMNYLDLSGGYNYLIPASGTMVITGKIKGYPCLIRTLSENSNRWNSSNTAPVFNVDYQTYNANCRPGVYMNLTDNAPGYLVCNSGGGTTSISSELVSSLQASSIEDNIVLSTTDYNNTSLTAATNNATGYLTVYDGLGNDGEALDRMNQIISYLLDNSSTISHTEILKLLSYANEAVAGMNKPENLVTASTYSIQISTLLNTYDRLTEEYNPADSSEYLTWYELSLGKAHIFHTSGQYDEALNEIDKIIPFCYPDQVTTLNRQYCLISNERDLINRVITTDEFIAAIQMCDIKLRSMSGANPSTENKDDSDVLSMFAIFPNPANNTIYFDLNKECSYSVKVINLSGTTVMNTEIMGGGKRTIDISSLPQGVYFIEAVGENIFIGRFVKE